MFRDSRAILRMLKETTIAALVLVLTILSLWALGRLTPGGEPGEVPSGTPVEVVDAVDEALGTR